MINPSKVLPVGTVLRSESRTYTIVEVLGQGGFGITYHATAVVTVENIKAEAHFAIKEHFVDRYCEREDKTYAVAYSRPVADEVENSRKDFLSEARRLRDLSRGHKRHPNIVCVNETFEANNTAYFVMEYLKGESLSNYVQRCGALNDDEMRGIMLPVIDAVAFLHRECITHLDIKPANIMITRDDDGALRPVLIDFGLSRHFDPTTGEPSSSIQQAGFSEGYAPVEQVEAFSHFYPGTDVYSLGATMLYALTGNTPVSAANLDDETLRSSIPAGLPASTVAAITESMHIYRKHRPADAAALLAILAGDDNTRIFDTDRIIPEIYDPGRTEKAPKPAPRPTPEPEYKSKPSTKSKKGLYIGIGVVALVVLLCAVAWLTHGSGSLKDAANQKPIDLYITPNHLDLIVEYNGQQESFSSDEWSSLSSAEQSKYTKIGMYIDGDDDFIVELYDKESGREMTWDEAMNKYRDVMPTKAQGEDLASIGWETWEAMMNAYGGDASDWFWTNEEDDSSGAWLIHLYYGNVITNGKAYTGSVRAVAPVI